jgi:hypothetical protein
VTVAVSNWAAVGTAVAIAIAALAALASSAASIASWRSVNQANKRWLTERKPHLEMIVLDDLQSRQVSVQVYNTGGGLARDVLVALVEGNQYILSYTPGGVLVPGSGVDMQTPFVRKGRSLGAVVGFVSGVDISGTVRAWSADGLSYKEWERKDLQKQPVSNRDMLLAVSDIDIDKLNPVQPSGWTQL